MIGPVIQHRGPLTAVRGSPRTASHANNSPVVHQQEVKVPDVVNDELEETCVDFRPSNKAASTVQPSIVREVPSPRPQTRNGRTKLA